MGESKPIDQKDIAELEEIYEKKLNGLDKTVENEPDYLRSNPESTEEFISSPSRNYESINAQPAPIAQPIVQPKPFEKPVIEKTVVKEQGPIVRPSFDTLLTNIVDLNNSQIQAEADAKKRAGEQGLILGLKHMIETAANNAYVNQPIAQSQFVQPQVQPIQPVQVQPQPQIRESSDAELRIAKAVRSIDLQLMDPKVKNKKALYESKMMLLGKPVDSSIEQDVIDDDSPVVSKKVKHERDGEPKEKRAYSWKLAGAIAGLAGVICFVILLALRTIH